MCGERGASSAFPWSIAGSSPRVRGTHEVVARRRLPDRFIPACAGNAARSHHQGGPLPVHPRVCGERPDSPIRQNVDIGSSPRVRGTLVSGGNELALQRFIPACAGNAGVLHLRYGRRTVHPRVCGERLARLGAEVDVYGSSPRVRGTLFRDIIDLYTISNNEKPYGPFRRSGGCSSGWNATRRSPSKSTGMRRLRP